MLQITENFELVQFDNRDSAIFLKNNFFFNIVVKLALTVPESINVNESTSMSIKCMLLGGETGATFQWFKDGNELTAEKGETLKNISVKRAINGSKYHCKASINSIDGESNRALVTVNCKFMFYSLQQILE